MDKFYFFTEFIAGTRAVYSVPCVVISNVQVRLTDVLV